MLNLPGEFRGFISKDSHRKYFSNNPFKPRLLNAFFNNLFMMIYARGKPNSMLEVGCGEGIAGYLIKHEFEGLDYVGADIRMLHLRVARNIVGKELVGANGMNLPFPDRSFDMVLFLEVFEHVAGWEKALAEGLRVARKSVIFSVPAYPWYQLSNLVFGKNVRRLGEHHDHINQFGREDLKVGKEFSFSNTSRTVFKISYVKFSFPWIIAQIDL